MRLILVTLCAVAASSAIRVPTAWPDKAAVPRRSARKSKSLHQPPVNDWIPVFPLHLAERQQRFAAATRDKPVRRLANLQQAPRAQDRDDTDAAPEGIDVYDTNRALFDASSAKFDAQIPEEENEEEEEEADDGDDFVPTRTYAQVRRSEDEEHVPPDPDEPRLKEVLKDAKIQTVYEEEGYEDAGYDHAGHEKAAEEDEAYGDATSSGSEYQPKSSNKVANDNFIQSERTKTTKKMADSEMEISSELSVVAAPNNATQKHRYVKIYPKVYRYDRVRRDAKFPYYNDAKINPDSPLKYAQHPNSVPVKIDGEMAFYEAADNALECAEVDTNIDPIPERVKNGEPKPNDDVEIVPGARLNKLGDKIDCFKAKYFGGPNPLDNPLFSENEIAPVLPIFSSFKQKTSTTTDAPITIITTPAYTIDLQPKHIYDQIQLLQYLPGVREPKSLDPEGSTEALKWLRKRPNRYFKRTSTTPRPIGEVPYKNEIKPSEQLTVFADIINNIKNSTKEMAKERVTRMNSTPLDHIEQTNSFYLTTSTPKVPQVEEVPEESIVGMMPPGGGLYKTIQFLVPVVAPHIQPKNDPKLNQYFYIGMKPPSIKEKVMLYSDFMTKKRRSKRSRYSAVVRNRNKPIDGQDDDESTTKSDDLDDYVPHRPQNYHYDTETGRIVYDKRPEVVEEEVEEVVTEPPLPKPTQTTVSGPSYIEYVAELRTNPQYVPIPDPTTTTTEKGVTMTPVPPSTTPPAFLGILAKVKSNAKYIAIEDKTTSGTTTEEVVPDEEVTTGRQGILTNDKNDFQIFDINDYLPKVKSYTPRTSIDYSKYKTIERPMISTRHNLSSRYNSEEQPALMDINTNRVPIHHEESTTRKVLRSRTRSTTPTTSTSSPIVVMEAAQSSQAPKTRRTYRRKPTRIRLNNDEMMASGSEVIERRADVESFAKVDKKRRHGGNYRKIESDESKMAADVVVHPLENGKLATKVNALKEVEDEEEGDGEVLDEVLDEYEATDEDYREEKGEEEEVDEGKVMTKKPLFIKDPSKRLYYYAPI